MSSLVLAPVAVLVTGDVQTVSNRFSREARPSLFVIVRDHSSSRSRTPARPVARANRLDAPPRRSGSLPPTARRRDDLEPVEEGPVAGGRARPVGGDEERQGAKDERRDGSSSTSKDRPELPATPTRAISRPGPPYVISAGAISLHLMQPHQMYRRCSKWNPSGYELP
jgi:hypothetical protein